jgi:hypothetical protein
VSRVVPALIVLAALAPALCDAAGRGKSGSPPGKGRGPVFPTLPDGTPVEPSTYRVETTESADVLTDGSTDWEVDAVGGSVDRLEALQASSLEWVHAEVRRGVGAGVELSAQAETWNQVVVQQGALRQSVPQSGYGPTTLTLRQRLIGGGDSGPTSCLGFRVRLPGQANGPGTRVAEGGVFVPISFPLGKRARLAVMGEGDLVPNALDTGRHVQGIASLELSRDANEWLSFRSEAVSVWNGETGRPWTGSLNAGVSVDPLSHLELTLGAAAGWTATTGDVGCYGRLSVHP